MNVAAVCQLLSYIYLHANIPPPFYILLRTFYMLKLHNQQIVRATICCFGEERRVGSGQEVGGVTWAGAKGDHGGSEAEQPGDRSVGQAGKRSGWEDLQDAGRDQWDWKSTRWSGSLYIIMWYIKIILKNYLNFIF